MRRHLLPLAILGLLTLVLADRASELLRSHQAAEPVASETRSATPDLKRRSSGGATAPAVAEAPARPAWRASPRGRH